jgi:energy-converting hydrogenase Eha subunit C
MQRIKVRKGFAFLAIGFIAMAAIMYFDQLYTQALLNVIVAILFGVAYTRA